MCITSNFGAKNYKAEMFGFETYWRKDIGEKNARKMLMKLTPTECFTDLGKLNFILGSSQFTLLPQLALKITLDLKVVKIISKINNHHASLIEIRDTLCMKSSRKNPSCNWNG